MQRVGVSEVTLAVDSELGAKLMSMDRGQALEVLVGSRFLSVVVILYSSSNGMCQEYQRWSR